MEVKKYESYWAVYDKYGKIVCVKACKKDAIEAKKRIEEFLKQISRENNSILLAC